MKLGNPIPVTAGVFQIRAIGARVTVLVEDDEVLLVDTGMKGSSGMIVAGLRAIGLSADMVRTVVVSHHHPDHVGALSELVDGRDIVVAAHRLEAGILRGTELPPNPIQNRMMARLTQPVIDRMNGTPVAVDIEVEDGDAVPFASPALVVHLPGHTAGSIALFMPDKRLVIVGDTLQYKFALKLSPPDANVTQHPQQAMESLNKLLDLDFDTICFSHFPPMRGGAHAALRRMIEQYSG